MSVHFVSSARRRLVVVPLAIAALLLSPANGALAATVVFKATFKDLLAYGSTSTSGPCLSTGTSIFAEEDEVFYIASTYDNCTDVGTVVVGEAVPTVFEVRGNLETVHVVAAIPLRDQFTGKPTGEVVNLDNTWSAVSKPLKTRSSSTQHLPGEVRFAVRFSGLSVEATVTGTVPLDTSANVSKSTSTSVTVTHG